jgi:transposase
MERSYSETDVKRLIAEALAPLLARIAEQDREISALKAEIARLKKNSSNSSKPPSSDIVKPPKEPLKGGGKRKIGGQVGHEKHEREPFGEEEIDRVESHDLSACPACGGRVVSAGLPERVIQQAELVKKPVEIVEHRSAACRCVRCGKVHYAAMPGPVERGGLLGPKLTALVGYLKGVCHASFSTIRRYFRDVLKLTISRGHLVKVVQKAAAAMAQGYHELRALLPQEEQLNIDETGHNDRGELLWTWCARAKLYTLYKIDPSRGSDVLVEMLGKDFQGVLGCDYFSAYKKYMGDFDVAVQFCLAHLIREVKFLTTLPDKVTAAYGQRVLEGLRKMFHVIHRRAVMEPGRFQRTLEQRRDELIAIGKHAPERKEARNLADRFRKHGEAYFRFVTTPGIEPTNNLAEQAIRFVVIDRLVTQGTRSEKGQRWCERIWTAIATCRQQDRSIFEYLGQSIDAHFTRTPAPSLLPAGP